jgi:hypothetical protein
MMWIVVTNFQLWQSVIGDINYTVRSVLIHYMVLVLDQRKAV